MEKVDDWRDGIGWRDYLEMQLSLSASDFEQKLKSLVDTEQKRKRIRPLFKMDDSGKIYFGRISEGSFSFQQRMRFADPYQNFSKVNGVFQEEEGKVNISMSVFYGSKWMLLFLLPLLCFYCAIIGVVVYNTSNSILPFFIVPFLLLHGAFMVGIIYFSIRRNVKRMKYILERELYFLTKD